MAVVRAKMRNMKTSSSSLFFLLLVVLVAVVTCFDGAAAQIVGLQPQFAPNVDRSRQLSPNQQGQILSDVQQHQHRFSAPSRQNFQPHQFSAGFLPQEHREVFQYPDTPKEAFAQNEFLSALPLLSSVPPNLALPTQQSSIIQQNPVVFPGQNHQNVHFNPQPQYIKPRPTPDPVTAIEHQIRLLDPEKHKQKIKELREKQSIIEKHNQFVERQYEKALKKAQQEHEQFLEEQREQKKKLYQKLYKPNNVPIELSNSNPPRLLYPEETPLFEQAVKQYYNEHPTTTTTTTTQKPSTTKKNKNAPPSFLPTVLPQVKVIKSLEDLDQLQKEYKSQRIRKNDLLEQLRLAITKSQEDSAKNLTSREISLAFGKHLHRSNDKEGEITLPGGKKVSLLRADTPGNDNDEEVTLPTGHQVQIIRTTDPKLVPQNSNEDVPQEITLPNGQKAQLLKAPKGTNPVFRTEEITLPNGERVEVIRTSDPSLVPDGVKLEPGSDLEKLVLSRTTTTTTVKPAKAVLDELTKDEDYELLKTGSSGGLESIGKNIPKEKKVTFVLLEEQSDGTLKVQGIKGNGKDKPDVDVESILKKLKQGQIKIPSSGSGTTTTTPRPTSPRRIQATVTPNSFASYEEYSTRRSSSEESSVPVLKTNIGTHLVASSTPTTIYRSSSTTYSTTPRPTSTTTKRIVSRTPHILNNHRPNDLIKQASTVQANNDNSIHSSLKPAILSTTEPAVVVSSTQQVPAKTELPEILKRNGLFAMAKFLKQSGLDTILNETGPYTVFVPTDKAFRTLLVQLGGPEKAEEKFRENPRLLSGLLLHHVIPGSFELSTLQDEMTGVSLAGTQLRVNQYTMHDLEWNDIKVTTINGAKIMDEKKDLEIPQGIAHAVDRVMFPLPVGDIVQTLQSDRERRFTSFLRAIFSSGLSEMLQGSRTFTLFAPTEKAFSGLSTEDLTKIVTDKVLARELVLKHLVPGTLYTNGMRYYQIKDSLLQDKQITLSKQSGKIKVNNHHIVTQNIPATNGVIHALDALL